MPNRALTCLVIEVVKGIKGQVLCFECLTFLFINNNKKGILEALTVFSKAFVVEKWFIRDILVPMDISSFALISYFFPMYTSYDVDV